MPATEYQGSSAPLASFGRSFLSLRRDQVHAMDLVGGGAGDSSSVHCQELEAFQRHAADLLHDLAGGGDDACEVLSMLWIRRLLDTFLICLEEFRAVLFNVRSGAAAARPAPLDRLVADFFERAVKALDVCNAVRDGIGQVKQWQKHIEIALAALDTKHKSFTLCQIRRARKALTDLTVVMLDEKDAAAAAAGSVINHRNRSFGRNNAGGKDLLRSGSGGHFRSLSWSVSRSWSAAKQLQAIGNNLAAPRANDVAATNGFAVPVFTMNSVLLFAMWALVAAIPCQDRGLQTHFSVPRSFLWAAPLLSLHERIVEESKKKDGRKHCNGLLKEIRQVEKCAIRLIELLDDAAGGEVPIGKDREAELRHEAEELAVAFESMKEGLDPIELQVREVFHRIVRSRTDCLDCGMLQA